MKMNRRIYHEVVGALVCANREDLAQVISGNVIVIAKGQEFSKRFPGVNKDYYNLLIKNFNAKKSEGNHYVSKSTDKDTFIRVCKSLGLTVVKISSDQYEAFLSRKWRSGDQVASWRDKVIFGGPAGVVIWNKE